MSTYNEQMEKYFKQPPTKSSRHDSPSGRYYLIIDQFQSRPGSWSVTRGSVFLSDGTPIVVVPHNYDSFPFCWLENHPSGKDFLICGETYQTTTTVNLHTRSCYHDKTDVFCNVTFFPGPDNQHVLVHGCYWGGPYEFKLMRFDLQVHDLVKTNLEIPHLPALDYMIEDVSVEWLDSNIAVLSRSDRKFKTDDTSEWILNHTYDYLCKDVEYDDFYADYNVDNDDLWEYSVLLKIELHFNTEGVVTLSLGYVLPALRLAAPKSFPE